MQIGLNIKPQYAYFSRKPGHKLNKSRTPFYENINAFVSLRQEKRTL